MATRQGSHVMDVSQTQKTFIQQHNMHIKCSCWNIPVMPYACPFETSTQCHGEYLTWNDNPPPPMPMKSQQKWFLPGLCTKTNERRLLFFPERMVSPKHWSTARHHLRIGRGCTWIMPHRQMKAPMHDVRQNNQTLQVWKKAKTKDQETKPTLPRNEAKNSFSLKWHHWRVAI